MAFTPPAPGTSHRETGQPQSDRSLLTAFGPGLITGASDDDPSGIATYSQAGAQFGYSVSWTMLLTYPLMTAVQEISARIGRVTGKGIAGNMRKHYPRWLLQTLVLLLSLANVINIDADLGAMGDALGLLIGGPRIFYVALFGLLCAVLQIFMSYTRYVAVLKWLSLALLSYFATAMVVHVPWAAVAWGLFVPTFSSDAAFWTMVVAIFGTTISPYLFFWQASQEAEDIKAVPERKPLLRRPGQAVDAFQRIRLDTYIGMAFSNLVALAIIVTTAATLNANGITHIATSAQAAEALKPVAGELAFAVFALGIIGTGLLSVPVLAGSAAYALGETRQWHLGLDRKPLEAKEFYAAIALATFAGVVMNLSPIDPIRALYWSAVINGVVAVPVMVIMMLMTGDPKVMGKFTAMGPLRVIGWLATGIMAAAVVAMTITGFV
jgi:NRAMP (natural resistance-associated macrophage protein)-like metal ion transporter